MTPTPLRSAAALALVLALAAAIALGARPAHATDPDGGPAAGAPTARDIMQLNTEVQDSAKAFGAVQKARRWLAGAQDSSLRVFLHRVIINGLIVGNAPGKMVVAAADSALRTFKGQPLQQVVINGEVAQYLVNHGDLAPRALSMARAAALGVPADPQYDPFRGFALGTLGEAYLLNDRPDSALIVLKRALPISPDSQRVLRGMGAAYERTKQDDLAIDSYVRALGVYQASDTTALTSARALWLRKGRPLAKLEERVASARVAGKNAVLDSHRWERPAPAWTLPDLEGKSHQLADFAGKVVVLDFWGTWCGPCRQELPIYQKMFERYRDKGVVFYGVNWERTMPGQDPKPAVREYLTKNGLTFPVVLDHERTAQTAYDIEAFPTVFLIDKSGKIRYRNVGVEPNIEHVLADQIESLLD